MDGSCCIYLMNQVIVHQQQKLQQICDRRERLNWIMDFKSEWKKLSKWPINNVYVTDRKFGSADVLIV